MESLFSVTSKKLSKEEHFDEHISYETSYTRYHIFSIINNQRIKPSGCSKVVLFYFSTVLIQNQLTLHISM